MNQPTSFHEVSYILHEKNNILNKGELTELQKSWFQSDTVDYWRHDRMYTPLSSLLKEFPNSKWITIGDGRFGLDSIHLKKIEPTLNVLPTDLSVDLLDIAKQKGLISQYEKLNAEHMNHHNDEFDFAFCKESYHHFPRPYIALYEMLRVAKTGIILVEPNDFYHLPWLGNLINKGKYLLKKILNWKIYPRDQWCYENIGNYIYTISKRELKKVALGLNMPAIATYYYNDCYENGVEYEKATKESSLFKKVKRKIALSNLKCKIGLKPYSSLIGIIFKEEPSEQVIKDLKKSGFEFTLLPKNPYVPRIKGQDLSLN